MRLDLAFQSRILLILNPNYKQKNNKWLSLSLFIIKPSSFFIRIFPFISIPVYNNVTFIHRSHTNNGFSAIVMAHGDWPWDGSRSFNLQDFSPATESVPVSTSISNYGRKRTGFWTYDAWASLFFLRNQDWFIKLEFIWCFFLYNDLTEDSSLFIIIKFNFTFSLKKWLNFIIIAFGRDFALGTIVV